MGASFRIGQDAVVSKRDKVRERVAATASQVLGPADVARVLLKGIKEEYLIVTDKELYIVKRGFATGNLLSESVLSFQLNEIHRVYFEEGLLEGYLEVPDFDLQRSWTIASAPSDEAMHVPNVIPFDRHDGDLFREASVIINGTLIPKARATNEQ